MRYQKIYNIYEKVEEIPLYIVKKIKAVKRFDEINYLRGLTAAAIKEISVIEDLETLFLK